MLTNCIHGFRLSVLIIIVLVELCGAVRDANAESAASSLPVAMAAQISANGKAVHMSAGEPGLLPLHAASTTIREAIAAEKPSILIEAIFILPRAKSPNSQMKAASPSRAGELASIYGILRSLGSLQGIEYYSASRKKMRTLYAESYIIDGPNTKVRMPDPRAPMPGMLPATETLFAFQRDLSFGANIYRYDFTTYSDAVELKSLNLTRMKYGLLPVLSPNELVTRILVIQADDAIIFYAESGAKTSGIFKDKIQNSFSNRAEALFKWFSAKYASL
jgi:hypothetical protein